MEVSVIIPNLNGERFLSECIESLAGQTYKDFELIFVDNASSDDSVKIVEEFKDKLDLTIIQNHENLGFAPAVNQGIKIARGEFVLLFNNDAFAFPDYMEKLVEFIKRDEKIFAVSSLMIRYFEKDKIDDAGDYYNVLGWASKYGDGLPLSAYNRPRRVFSACGGASIYRKDVLFEIGLFDENFFAYLEDVDVSFRGNIAGYKNMYCPDAKTYHIASATSGSKYNAFKAKCAGRNSIYLAYKNLPFLLLVLNFFPLVFGYFVKYVFSCTKGFGKAFGEGFSEAMKNLPKIKKTKFKFKNFFNYFYIECSMIAGVFKYAFYRIRLFLSK